MVYQLKIKLLDVKKPPVWRRVLVPADCTFDFLHQVIQKAMGWDGYHLYQFGYDEYDDDFIDVRIPDPADWDAPSHDALKTRINRLFNDAHPLIKYVYDFGDNWIHDVVLEKKFKDDEVKEPIPYCLAAKGACPPEDCGGPWGYEDLKLLAASNPTDEESIKQLEWYGIYDDFNPKYVDIDCINRVLSGLHTVKVPQKKVDPKKLEERKSLLKTLTSGFCNKRLEGNCVDYCNMMIDRLANGKKNITGGRAEIWAAAIVLVATEGEIFDDIDNGTVARQEIYDYFGVKAAGVLSRATIVRDQQYTDIDEDINNLTPDAWDTLLDMVLYYQKTGELPPGLEDLFGSNPTT